MDHLERMVNLVLMEDPENKDCAGPEDSLVTRESQDDRENRVHRDLRVDLETKESEAHPEHLEYSDPKACLDHEADLVREERGDLRDRAARLVRWDLQALPV